jgi:hypothetical protein
MWCNQYNELLGSLSSLKEYDIDLTTKIKLMDSHLVKLNNDENIIVKNEIKTIKDYVIGIKEFKFYTWNEKLQMVKDFIDVNKFRPRVHTKDKYELSISYWLQRQIFNYKNKCESMCIKSNYDNWTEFINNNNYSSCMKNKYDIHIDKWYEKFNLLKEFINKYKRRPSNKNNNENEKSLAYWLDFQNDNFKNNKMLNEDIKNEWIEFKKIKLNYDCVKTRDEIWLDNFEEIKLYIDLNKKFISSNKNSNLVRWFGEQTREYNQNKMTEERIFLWKEFIENKKYNQYFKIDNDDLWKNNLEDLKIFIDENNKRPSINTKYYIKDKFNNDIEKQEYLEMVNNIKKNNYLAHWISDNNTDYKQNKLDEDRMKMWKEFIEDDKYYKYFMSSEELWYLKFEEMKKFIVKYNKRPPRSGLINNIKNDKIKNLGGWLHSQLCNYKCKKSTIYINDKIRQTWEKFIQDDFFGQYVVNSD